MLSEKYITGNTFSNISAIYNGGALSLEGARNIVIQSNTFENIGYSPLSNQEGGAIYISPTSNFIAIHNNSFLNCSAHIGGAIKWGDSQPSFQDNTFVNNSASVYGDNEASYATTL